MNVLFTTQSAGLRLFDALGQTLVARGAAARLGFTVADRWHYSRWLREKPSFETAGHVLVKEWDVTSHRIDPPDYARLAEYEQMLAGPSGVGPGLFGAIVADRRLIMGPDCTYAQDYRRRFDDETLLRILQDGCETIERAFDALRPSLVVGFVCVSFLEYLAFLFARARGVRYLNLRTARIANRVFLSDTHRDPAAEVAATLTAERIEGADWDLAGEWLTRARIAHANYEGVVAPSLKPAQRFGIRGSRIAAPFRFARTLVEYWASGAAKDNHVPSPLRAAVFKAVVNPVRARRVDRALRPLYVTQASLRGRRFAMFPLHTEPEVSLLLYGRPLVNQTELLRAIAFSLPADMVLVAKEHPWMVGKRSISAYRKMLRIPRLHLAPPEITVRDLLAGASLAVVHTGSTWLEAALLKKPVIALGPVMGELLPSGMVRRCKDLTMLPETIAQLLVEARHDEIALQRLVAAITRRTVAINLYTGLLDRPAYTPDGQEPYTAAADISRLADFLLARVSEPSMAGTSTAHAAPW